MALNIGSTKIKKVSTKITEINVLNSEIMDEIKLALIDKDIELSDSLGVADLVLLLTETMNNYQDGSKILF